MEILYIKKNCLTDRQGLLDSGATSARRRPPGWLYEPSEGPVLPPGGPFDIFGNLSLERMISLSGPEGSVGPVVALVADRAGRGSSPEHRRREEDQRYDVDRGAPQADRVEPEQLRVDQP